MTAALCHVKSSSGSHCGQFAHSWPHLLLGHPVERRSAGTKRISLQGNSEPAAGDVAAAAAAVRSVAFKKRQREKNTKRVKTEKDKHRFVAVLFWGDFFLSHLAFDWKKISGRPYCCFQMTNIPSFNMQTSICLCLTANAFQTQHLYIWIHLKCKVKAKLQWRLRRSKRQYFIGNRIIIQIFDWFLSNYITLFVFFFFGVDPFF